MAGRSPDYDLMAMNKIDNTQKGKIGVGWRNDNGAISIKFSVLVQLPGDISDWMFTLFPARADNGPKKSTRKKAQTPDVCDTYPDDEIPF